MEISTRYSYMSIMHKGVSSIKGVIMSGGMGTRLRPLTCHLPKPMVPIFNKDEGVITIASQGLMFMTIAFLSS